ncbi:hypothetical protein BKA62DRAFT_695714 [Auriculariales sp. MPI-PUGE-AT-0066]|nr:hypothetical protein BKA62DRAFT_695714 [Auriculariales sp. MPI-PUGE-AT-0066]
MPEFADEFDRALASECQSVAASIHQALVRLLGATPESRVLFQRAALSLANSTRLSIQTFGSLLNRHTDAICKLSPDLVLLIVHYSTSSARTAMSQTCTTWRRTLLNQASAWTTITWREKDQEKGLRLRPSDELARSEPLDFDIEVDLCDTTPEKLCKGLCQHLKRCRRLSVVVECSPRDVLPKSTHYSNVSRLQEILLYTKAPRLRQFHLRDQHNLLSKALREHFSSDQHDGRWHFFGLSRPYHRLLTEMSFDADFRSSGGFIAFDRVTHLRSRSIMALSPDFLPKTFPQVTHLTLDMADQDSLATLFATRLQSLTLVNFGKGASSDDDEFLVSLYDNLSRASETIQSVEIHLHNDLIHFDEPSLSALRWLFNRPIDSSMVVLSSTSNHTLSGAVRNHGRVRCVYNLPEWLIGLPEANTARSSVCELWIPLDDLSLFYTSLEEMGGDEWQSLTSVHVFNISNEVDLQRGLPFMVTLFSLPVFSSLQSVGLVYGPHVSYRSQCDMNGTNLAPLASQLSLFSGARLWIQLPADVSGPVLGIDQPYASRLSADEAEPILQKLGEIVKFKDAPREGWPFSNGQA